MNVGSNTITSNGASMNGATPDLFSDASIDELDNIRLREITGKAVSGTLLLLLKWFKRSRESCHQMFPQIHPSDSHRYIEVRIYDTTSTRLQLYSLDPQDVCTPRC